MKLLTTLVVVAMCVEIGFSLPAKTVNNLKSSNAGPKDDEESGKYCIIDSDVNTVECTLENSVLPDNLNVNSAKFSSDFVCLNVSYQTGIFFKTKHDVLQCALQLAGDVTLCPLLEDENTVFRCIVSTPYETATPVADSGQYCIIDDEDNTVECTWDNSVLPEDIFYDGGVTYANNFVCLDVTYKSSWNIFASTEHVQQCARALVDEDLCEVLEDLNNISACTDETPYTTPTVVPPSGVYCQVDDDGDMVQCNKTNSILPTDISIGNAPQSDSYVCVSVTYKTGIWPFKTTHSTQQCALQIVNGDLCEILEMENTVTSCTDWLPVTTPAPTAAPTTARPTTARPTTARPTTARPTTAAPTTAAPTTAAPTTAAPTTAAPTTAAPTTAPPTTAPPTTAPPTTAPPTTAPPTTAPPTTAPPTTAPPTTAPPTTAPPTTAPPTTAPPTTAPSTTAAPPTETTTTAAPTADTTTIVA